VDIKFLGEVFGFGFLGGVLSCALLEVPLLTGILASQQTSVTTVLKKCTAFIVGMTLSYMMIGYFFTQLAYVFNRYWHLSGYILGGLGVLGIVWGMTLLLKFSPHHCHDEDCSHHLEHPGFFHKILHAFMPTSLFHFFLLGLIFAWFETPVCPGCGPMLFTLASLTLLKGHTAFGALTFGIYSLGQGFPVMVLSVLLLKGFSLETLSKFRPAFHFVAANVLVFSGVVLLWLA
jgi:cytochrome c biogenesis protein CcdA